MKLVVDTNCIFAALLRDRTCREILTSRKHTFVTPDFTLEEIKKHAREIQKRSGLAPEAFDLLMSLLFINIEVIPHLEYDIFLPKAKKLIGDQDMKDVPFVACALALKIDGIWSDDQDFLAQKKIMIYTMRELV
ncbi:MAG: PIN domain-containing protein [Nanoarchaeota archaeon]